MKILKRFLPGLLVVIFAASCGRDGDPGHTYFSLDWEYYNEDYGVYYYEDNNPDVPDSEDIIPRFNYDCYPGYYEFYYESEDPSYWYTYEGYYELFQNPGSPGGLFHDGMDGADSYFMLFLYVDPDRMEAGKKNSRINMASDQPESLTLKTTPETRFLKDAVPVHTEFQNWEQSEGAWTMKVQQEVKVYLKSR